MSDTSTAREDLQLTLEILDRARAITARRMRGRRGPLSIEQIADITGQPISTIRDLHDRAMRKLIRAAQEKGLFD